MMVIDPRGLEPRDWIDYTADTLSSLVPVMKVESGDQWREWGYHVRQTLRSSGILTPDPDQFEDWREWAQRFNQVVSSVRS